MKHLSFLLGLCCTLGADDEKIAPRLKAQIAGGRAAPVILLGKTQLLDGSAAFPAFCKKHNDRKRIELRGEVTAKLKKIAATEQPKMRAALKLPAGISSETIRLYGCRRMRFTRRSNAASISGNPATVSHLPSAAWFPSKNALA